jgi:hypothetical protein
MQFFLVPNFGHLTTRGWNSIGFFGGEKKMTQIAIWEKTKFEIPKCCRLCIGCKKEFYFLSLSLPLSSCGWLSVQLLAHKFEEKHTLMQQSESIQVGISV